MLRFCCKMMQSLKGVNDRLVSPEDSTSGQVRLRLGLHLGTVFGGVLGAKQYQYQIWGEALEKATRMESSGRPSQVHLSPSIWRRVERALTPEIRKRAVHTDGTAFIDLSTHSARTRLLSALLLDYMKHEHTFF